MFILHFSAFSVEQSSKSVFNRLLGLYLDEVYLTKLAEFFQT